MTYLDMLRIQLRIDEGERDKPYVDTKGKITIGVGRNLTDVGVDGEERTLMFENDLSRAVAVARRLYKNFDTLNDVRKAVVVNMAFNMSMKLAGFVRMNTAINEERWEDAAAEMINSDWDKEVGSRAVRLATHMSKGV